MNAGRTTMQRITDSRHVGKISLFLFTALAIEHGGIIKYIIEIVDDRLQVRP